jgi:hypothetical protein
VKNPLDEINGNKKLIFEQDNFRSALANGLTYLFRTGFSHIKKAI